MRYSFAALLPASLLFAGLVTVGSPADAIPAFARKYEVDCQRCHVAYPKLTAFGEAFRRNGYRFPAGEDEEATYETDISLGHEAYKQVFPDAVWPGKLPGEPPIAATLGSTVEYVRGEGSLDLSGLGGSLGFIAAGSLGNVVSGWVGFGIEAGFEDGEEVIEPELERAFLRFKVFEQPWLNVQVGRFELALPGVTSHRMLGASPWLNSTTIGDNAFTLGPAQNGFQVDGVLDGRVLYTGGVVEGRGNAIDDGVDTYGRVGYKIGGLRPDGIGAATSSRPWRDDHVTIGVFGLAGQARIGNEAANQADDYARYGADVEAWFWDLQLHAAYGRGVNRQPFLREPGTSAASDFVFTQLDWVAYPWLVGSARWEMRRIGDDAPEHRIAPAAYVLFRPNIRFFVLAMFESTDHVDFDRASAGVSAAF